LEKACRNRGLRRFRVGGITAGSDRTCPKIGRFANSGSARRCRQWGGVLWRGRGGGAMLQLTPALVLVRSRSLWPRIQGLTSQPAPPRYPGNNRFAANTRRYLRQFAGRIRVISANGQTGDALAVEHRQNLPRPQSS